MSNISVLEPTLRVVQGLHTTQEWSGPGSLTAHFRNRALSIS